MIAARSLVLGFFAALLLVIATRPTYELRVVTAPAHRAPQIIDAAAGVNPARLLSAVRLAPGERFIAIDDRPFGAAGLVAVAARRAGSYVDLDIAGDAGIRRVVVLLH